MGKVCAAARCVVGLVLLSLVGRNFISLVWCPSFDVDIVIDIVIHGPVDAVFVTAIGVQE